MGKLRLHFTVSNLVNITLGLLLILDKIFFQLITFSYTKIGLKWLDPYFGHHIWGILLIFVGMWDAFQKH